MPWPRAGAAQGRYACGVTPATPSQAHPALNAAAAPPVRRGLVFGIVALALMMMSIDSTIVATALHALQSGLDTSIGWAGWTLTAYSFGFALMLPITGRLSERFGRRRVFMGSVAVFTLASLGCGLANDIGTLIALRVLQAAGGAGFTPSATGIIVDHFGDARDRAVSLFGSIFPIGAMIGPIFGGLFVTYGSWRGVFFVNGPIGLLILLLAWRFVPRDVPRRTAAGGRMDLPGLALMALALLAAMLAINGLGGRGGWGSAGVLGALAVLSLGAAALFVRHIRRVAQPFLAPRLVWGAGFGVVNLINAVFGGLAMGAVALAPLYATNRYGIGALAAGSVLIAQRVAAIVLTLAATWGLRRTGYRRPMAVGACAIVLGLGLLALRPPAGVGPYAWLMGGAFMVGVGMGVVNPASRNAGLQLAPQNASTLAALRTLFLQLGTIATVAIATAVLAHADDPGQAQAWVYAGLALFLLLALPLIRRVPEHRGAW